MNKKNTIDKASEKKRNTCNFNKCCVFFIHIYLVFLMCIYIYIYIHIYICIHLHICINLYIFYIYINLHIYIYVCMGLRKTHSFQFLTNQEDHNNANVSS